MLARSLLAVLISLDATNDNNVNICKHIAEHSLICVLVISFTQLQTLKDCQQSAHLFGSSAPCLLPHDQSHDARVRLILFIQRAGRER